MKRGKKKFQQSLSKISEKSEKSSSSGHEEINVGASTSAVADEIPLLPKRRNVAPEIEPAVIELSETESEETESEETVSGATVSGATVSEATVSGVTKSGFMAKVAKCWKCCRPSEDCECSEPTDIPMVRLYSVHSSTSSIEEASEKAIQAPAEKIRKTHYLSSLIPRVQCFFIPTNISVEKDFQYSPKLEVMKQILGVHVQFKKLECNAFMCVQCPFCGVCPHMFECSCPDKYPGTQWCAHLHTTQMITKGKYKGGMSLYIHTDIRYMLVRHLRAYVLGHEIMNPVPGKSGNYEELYKNCEILTKYKAKKTPEYFQLCQCRPIKCDICSACRCKFSCECIDYCIDKMVCMHVHCLAVRTAWSGSDKLNESHLMEKHKLTVQEDKYLKYIVAFEHEMSFFIKQKNIEKQEGPLPDDLSGESCIYSVVKRPVRQAYDSDTTPEESLDSEKTAQPKPTQSWWQIYKKSKGKRVEDCEVWTFADGTGTCVCNYESYQYCVCERCEICPDDYRCSCPLDDAIICRHIHAVHRLRTESKETEEEAEDFVRSHFELPVVLKFVPPEHINWIYPFPDDTPRAAKPQPIPALPQPMPVPQPMTD